MTYDDYIINSKELYHHGILGMKWGVRRYQNKDGSLTDAGKKRLVNKVRKDVNKGELLYNPKSKLRKEISSQVSRVLTANDRKAILKARDEYVDALYKTENAAKEYFAMMNKLTSDSDGYFKYQSNELESGRKPLSKDQWAADKIYEERPDLIRAQHSHEDAEIEYYRQCDKVVDKILGEYGDTPLIDGHSFWSVRDRVSEVVADILENE